MAVFFPQNLVPYTFIDEFSVHKMSMLEYVYTCICTYICIYIKFVFHNNLSDLRARNKYVSVSHDGSIFSISLLEGHPQVS